MIPARAISPDDVVAASAALAQDRALLLQEAARQEKAIVARFMDGQTREVSGITYRWDARFGEWVPAIPAALHAPAPTKES